MLLIRRKEEAKCPSHSRCANANHHHRQTTSKQQQQQKERSSIQHSARAHLHTHTHDTQGPKMWWRRAKQSNGRGSGKIIARGRWLRIPPPYQLVLLMVVSVMCREALEACLSPHVCSAHLVLSFRFWATAVHTRRDSSS